MNWSSRRQELYEIFKDTCDAERLSRLLDRFEESVYGLHLARCILIDVTTGLVPADLFTQVFLDFDLAAADPVHEFGLAVDRLELKGSISAHGAGKSDDHEPRSYARVMEMGKFIRWCLPERFRDMSPATLRLVRLLYFSNQEGRPLARSETFTGGRGRVWVLPYDDLDELRKKEDAGTKVRNALGLPIWTGVGPEGQPEFVAVLYPPSSTIKSKQPSTLDATWTSRPCYFLPARGSKGWGQTHNCACEDLSCRERVHGELVGLDSTYLGIGIGFAQTLDTSLWDGILNEADRRLEALRGEEGGCPSA